MSDSDSSLPGQQSKEGVVISPRVLDTILHSQSEILIPRKSHSQPGSLQGTPYAASEPPGSRPGSARKQWIVENEVCTVNIVSKVIKTCQKI